MLPLLLEVAERLERPPERLIASGLLHAEADGVAAAFARHGLTERERRHSGEWAAILLTRMIDIDDIRAAARRLDGVAHRTPVITSRTLDEATGAQVFLKAENLQRVGRLQVPRRLQRGRLAHRRASASAASPPSPPATTRRRSRSPLASPAAARRS